MKSLLYLCLILGLSLLGATQSSAQGGEGRMGNGKGYWIFGLNAGGAWQDSDIKALAGAGWGFYIGHSFYNPKDGFFSADARFRYLNTYTFGQNHRDNLFGNANLADSTQFSYRPAAKAFAHNHRTTFHDLSLELRLNFEKLRRETNIWLSLYAGAGLGIYGTKFNQKDASGNDYDYESIDYTQSEDDICRDIIALQDDTYETNAATDEFGDNLFRLTFTPTVGIELGYWFSPYFALGIGHRTTFTLQDNFEGVKINNGGAINSSIHHYTSLMLHWRVYGSSGSQQPCPDVQFQLPVNNGQTYTTNQSSVFISAMVSNVNRNQITYTVNGQAVSDYSYDSGTKEFRNNLRLQRGENRIVLRAKNSCGTSGQAIIVVYEPNNNTNTDPKQPPVVTITNPSTSPSSTLASTATITAQILHVTSKNNVVFSVNGNTGYNFNFSGTSFSASNVPLVQGQNTITVKGLNKDGSDSKTIIINYQKEEPLPVVTITNPNRNPYTVDVSQINLNATILNVGGRNNVTFTVNGQNSTNFSFSGTSFVANNIALNQGSNTLTVTGRNVKGQDVASTVVIYRPVVVQNPPVVTITNPNRNPYTTNNATARINATILNVVGASNVTYTVNGRRSNQFSFGGTNFSSTVNLMEGSNTISITGRNQDGQDTKSTVIIYRRVVAEPAPIVTITQPRANPFVTQQPQETIRATIQHVASRNNVTCTVNGRTNTSFSFSGTSFVLSGLTLSPGNNTIVITGRNNAGQDTKSTVVVYEKPLPRPPVVTIVAPGQNPYTTQASKETVSATIDHVTGRNNVTCTVNGQANSNFNFSGTSFTLANLNLQEGANTIVITGRNAAGQDSKSTVIIYEPVVQLPRPIVTITQPNRNPYTTQNNRININATIQHVANRNNVTFTFNGRPSADFTFSGTSFVMNNVVLQNGNNTVSITGRNSAGQDTKTTVIIYQAPVQEPSVVITSPNQNPFTTQNSPININATILNVASKNDVTFTINGRSNSNFTFSGTSFVASNVSLTPGNNTFVITGRNASGQSNASTVVVYRPIEPPVVTFTVPNQNPLTTPNSTTNISATVSNVSSKSDVTFTINGQATTNFSFSNNVLTANNINLSAGNNTFTVTGRNAAGQDSKSTVVVMRAPKPAPIVTITAPNQNPFTTATNRVTITATILNVSERNNINFTINGRPNTNFSFSGNTFTATNIPLSNGNNGFVITGRNGVGQDSKSAIVIYAPPVPKPVVTITTPGRNPYTVLTNTTSIQATVLNVASKNDVTFTVNGQNNTNFSFSGTAFAANNVALNVGNNTFTITGRNSSGQDTKSTLVIYKLPEKKPTVVITTPNQNPFNTQTNKVNITATILNVASKNNVTFTVNGQANTNFSFSGTAFVANNVTLNQGNNTFVITGTNGAGQDSKSTVVVYSLPIPKPVVTITNPAQSPYTVLTSATSIKATILNVASKNDVTFSVNGQANTNFSFSGTAFTANNIPLNVGNNTFVITGKNSAGRDSKTTVVVYQLPQKKPTVVITSPNQNPFNTQTNKVNIKATILNVPTKNDVTFTVNGQANTNFSFSGTAFVATNVSLNQGNNTFVITGRNGAGQDSKSTVVVYSQPVPKPVVTITTPAQSPFTTLQNRVTVKATILNVASKNDVTFTVNGQSNTSFIFNGNNFMAMNLPLNVGNNTFVITGRNSAGQDSKSTIVIYQLPQKKPTVVITSPNKNPFSTVTNKVNITATILDVASRNNVTFIVNGQANTNFSFAGTTFTASNVPLNQGNNTFVITGTNGAGQDSKSTVVVYTTGNPNGNGTGNTNQQGGGANNTGSGTENDNSNSNNKGGTGKTKKLDKNTSSVNKNADGEIGKTKKLDKNTSTVNKNAEGATSTKKSKSNKVNKVSPDLKKGG
ncbi:hypothetical protein [Aureispira sp. CCB-QB1]|uniref:beta strand repeat-containing protein n=1 Tax=Aureispira sp. CCB-QB1 TaxID=1313421 RepID=UPI000697A5A4|nr:hypothetical protein [Aureispira sp. CCB-QB1]